ncbi:virB8 family protein [Acinetobacter baumannii]|uniref:virB8 family protein n=1 Tax=Acinetobacter baumannii TaxID=470 RepID=UPI002341E52F|nr:type IV secretion system protein [Acinetobacter baumannii]MDC4147466.1 type IV secretion system protein [Acinetobacter baumannii]
MGWFFKNKDKSKSENNDLEQSEKIQKKIAREKERLEKDPTYAAKQFIEATKQFEEDKYKDNEKSKIIAWRVATGSCCLTALSIFAIVGLTPLKTVEPLIFRVDNNTGKVDIVSTLKNAQADYGEEVNKYFLAQYVKCREGYDWYTVQQTFNCAMLMSSEDEQNRLNTQMARADAPYKVLQDKKRINIKVNSVSFIGDGQAQVRYEKITEAANGGQYIAATGEVDPKPQGERWIATITFDYRNAPKKEEERYINPLGWTAITYRNDTESGVN